jgi:Bacterial PH domain
MAITAEEIAREKERLPRGWGRFGKSLDHLAEISEPDESLMSTCVALNPEYKQRATVGHDAVALGLIFAETRKSTNVVLACTNKRLIVLATGMGGGARDHYAISYDGLEIVSREFKAFTLGWPEGQVRIRGAHRKRVPEFLDAVAAQARPAPAAADS